MIDIQSLFYLFFFWSVTKKQSVAWVKVYISAILCPTFRICLCKTILLQDEEEISTSPGVSEFVSDAFDACNLNQEDLRKEMEQLVLDKKREETSVVEGKTTSTFCLKYSNSNIGWLKSIYVLWLHLGK